MIHMHSRKIVSRLGFYQFIIFGVVLICGCSAKEPLSPLGSAALALQAQGKIDEAIPLWEQAQRECPACWSVPYNLALIYDQRGETDNAIALYLQALSLNPESADSHNNIALLFLDKKKLDPALAHAKQATALDPSLPHYWYNLGLIHHKRCELALAEIAYEKAIDSDPKMALAHYNLGKLLQDRGDPISAIPSLSKALEYAPTMWEAAYSLATLQHKLGNLANAVHYYKLSLNIAPARGHAQENLAAAQAAEHALATLQIEISNSNLSALERAWAFHQKGFLHEAEQVYFKFMNEHPSDQRAGGNIAHVYLLQKRFVDAETAYKAALVRDPDNSALLQGLEAARKGLNGCVVEGQL